MRGDDEICGSLFSYVDLEKRVRPDHPLRLIREIANAALGALSGEFTALYSPLGRSSIPPERLMRALLLQAFYSLRSERQLVERIEYDLLFRWFVGLGIEDAVWDATTFTKNRDRLLEGEVAQQFLASWIFVGIAPTPHYNFTIGNHDELCRSVDLGSGSSELDGDGTIEIELCFHNGDDAISESAPRMTSSTASWEFADREPMFKLGYLKRQSPLGAGNDRRGDWVSASARPCWA